MGDNYGHTLSQAQKRRSEDDEHEGGRRPAPHRASRMRACAECKRHKIKCEPVANEAKCAKCLRSGAECVPYNLNQRFLDEDASWKANATVKLSQLRGAVQLLLRHTNLPDLDFPNELSPVASSRQTVSPLNAISEHGHSSMVMPPSMDMTRDSSAEPDSLDELTAVPMRSLYDLTRIRSLSNSMRCSPDPVSYEDDFIAQGLIPLAEAEELFKRYMHDIHLYLWSGVLFPYESLEAVRRNSSVLTAAVLTIAALHTPGRDESLQKCYRVFVSLTYNTCLSRSQSLDDIRAQALGAFYLSNLSWKLSGLAVRSAIEMDLHQSFKKLMRGHEDQRSNVRLWYALYVCEHQCSIAYGRPPTIHEDAAIRNIEQFLDSIHTKPGDIRLAAQVMLFKILAEAYNLYGSDPEHPLAETDLHQLQLFNFAIEQWRSSWQARSMDSLGIGSYPSKGVILHYHFARLQLNSLALRALSLPNAASFKSLSFERREATNVALSAATSTLTLIFEEPDLRCAMPAVPVFTHTMVAFCATFLLRMVKACGGPAQGQSPALVTEPFALGLNFNVSQALLLLRRSASFLAKVAENLNEKHLTRHIFQGIHDLLEHLDSTGAPVSGSDSTQTFQGPIFNTDVGIPNAYNMQDLIGSYDFGFGDPFLGQAPTNLDFWETQPLY